MTHLAIFSNVSTAGLALISAVSLSAPGHADPVPETVVDRHQTWSELLQAFVDERGLVDYQALHEDDSARGMLEEHVAWIESTSPRSHPELFSDRDDELAYWINAYNALVWSEVLRRGPETESVWSGLISGRIFFVKNKIVIGGERMSLKALEDDLIRDGYRDPRIHAALNCASIGCPRLPRHAFDGGSLQQQLEAAMTEFTNDERHVRLDGDTVYLSKIFDWFRRDFLDHERSRGGAAPTLLSYVNRFRSEDAMLDPDLRVDFLPYDKGINSQQNAAKIP